MAAFFLFDLGIGRKEGKDEGLEQTICKAFKVRLRLFLENLADCFPSLAFLGFKQEDLKYRGF